jgi:hypothetical protein
MDLGHRGSHDLGGDERPREEAELGIPGKTWYVDAASVVLRYRQGFSPAAVMAVQRR